MKKFAMISSNPPTEEQRQLAKLIDIEITYLPDINPWTVRHTQIESFDLFSGIFVDHPKAAMELANHFEIGIFNEDKEAFLFDWVMYDQI